jgi:lipoate-protein ligase A
MAIDRWMLHQQLEGAPPLLRLYRWSRPAVSLGRHQQRWPEHWRSLQAQGRIDLVRRASGGRAVLHAGELTYAIAMRPAQRQREAVYRHCCGWLQQAFAAAGEPLGFGEASAAAAAQRSSCFATATAADLIAADGSKRIGSAQLWQGPALLQHGSVLIDPPRALWQELFAADPPAVRPLPWQGDALDQQLRVAALVHLCGASLMDQPLSGAEWAAVRELEPLGAL